METILLVEDDANQRILYEMELEDEGYNLILTSTGTEAYWWLKEAHVDVVVLDLKSLDTEGEKVIDRLKGLKPDLPVIVYSAFDCLEDLVTMGAADACLVKRSDMEELKEEIRRVLLNRRGVVREYELPRPATLPMEACRSFRRSTSRARPVYVNGRYGWR